MGHFPEGRTKMRKSFKFLMVVSLALTVGACSSSKKSTSEETDELPAAETADAGTDQVPADPSMDAMSQSDPAASGASMGGEGYEQYTVQEGDTLMKIAFETYGDLYQWKAIYNHNKDKISNPNAIPRGTVLMVERPANPVTIDRNGEKYLIKQGDTLGTISNDVYGTKQKWKRLWENNKQLIRDPNKIFAGFYLYYLPGNGSQPIKPATPAPLASDPGTGSGTAGLRPLPGGVDPMPSLGSDSGLPPMDDAERDPAGQ
jgi:nucleoid-associated protein YgaU